MVSFAERDHLRVENQSIVVTWHKHIWEAYSRIMGIDKSMHEESPIVVIDGTVYQHGKKDPLQDHALYGDPIPDREEWLVEHHSYAKEYYCFHDEQEYRDFLDGLPESEHPPFKANFEPFKTRDRFGNSQVHDHAGFDREWERYWADACKWRAELAAKKRAERATLPPQTPAEAFTARCRADINAVLDANLKPFEDWDDPEISRQVSLIIQHHLREYRKVTGWKPMEDIEEDIEF